MKFEKRPMVVLTFHTTAGAMEAEAVCAARGIPGRLLPVPRRLTADCGIAWASPPAQRPALEALAEEGRLDPAGIWDLEL